MSASKAAIVSMPVGVRGDAGDVWRAAIGCGGFAGARGWPLAVHVCCESRLLPRRRACDEHKYCRAMQRQNCLFDARERASRQFRCVALRTRLQYFECAVGRRFVTFALNGSALVVSPDFAVSAASPGVTYVLQTADKAPQETTGRVL